MRLIDKGNNTCIQKTSALQRVAKRGILNLFSASSSAASMPRRCASPAPSEPEIEILGSLYPGDDEPPAATAGAAPELDVDAILNPPGAANDDDYEVFIGQQQAASYRKASNLKGRTVKKGGGFQAMGEGQRFSSIDETRLTSGLQALTPTCSRPSHVKASRFRLRSSVKRYRYFLKRRMSSAWQGQVLERRRPLSSQWSRGCAPIAPASAAAL